ncbi:MAG: FKBP-type peptidyl-prolyl cis-trans isomerase [Bacteroidota bacterium]|jgi:FKBP-type peptidyl-prolyl cis-trans isomerase
MKKNIIYILLLSIVGFISGCTTTDVAPSTDVSAETLASITAYGTAKGLTFTKDANSLFYVVTTKNPTGRTPLANEFVKLYYTYTKLDGTMLDSTGTNQKIPQAYPYLSYNTLLNYAVAYLKEGESGTVVFPSTSTFSEPTVLNATLISTRNETEQISEYVSSKFAGQTPTKTVSGLQYFITKTSASGDTAKTNKNVTVSYTGKLLFQSRTRDTNGFFIYTEQFDKGSFTFLVGANAVVPGFEEATKLLKVGDKGTFIFPSSLGYGKDGKFNNTTQLYDIPPYAPLLFEIEVTAVK